MKDIVIHRYTNQCKTVQLPPGFADFLKGTLYLYQSSLQIPNMELLVDFSHHPIGMFIDPMPKNMENPYDEWIQKEDISTEMMECFNKNSYKVKEMLQILREKDSNLQTSISGPYYLICHEAYEGFDDIISENQKVVEVVASPPEKLGKSYMKSVLRFNQEITEDCEYIKKTLNLTDTSYCVLHLRMGDQQSTQDHIQIPPSLEEFIQMKILPQWGKNILVMSDSFYTKKYLSEKYKITCTEFVTIIGDAILASG